MRKTLFTHMLNDVRRIKTKIKNHKQCLVKNYFKNKIFVLIKHLKHNISLKASTTVRFWFDQRYQSVCGQVLVGKTAVS